MAELPMTLDEYNKVRETMEPHREFDQKVQELAGRFAELLCWCGDDMVEGSLSLREGRVIFHGECFMGHTR